MPKKVFLFFFKGKKRMKLLNVYAHSKTGFPGRQKQDSMFHNLHDIRGNDLQNLQKEIMNLDYVIKGVSRMQARGLTVQTDQ